ncbi:MAG: hypothetical protein ACYTEK_00175, partial [Planctomycetota bacterium]
MVNSRSFRHAVVVAIVVMLVGGGVWAQGSTKPETAGPLDSIPGSSVFCVRINRLESSLGAVNEFLRGVAPESFDAKAMIFSKLGGLLGDERLRGVNRKGNFTLFAVNLSGESAGPGPMGNMFIGALLPVRNYDNFVSKNPNCSQADDQGISTITIEGRPRALVTNFR